jgi:acetone carboxylase gamma subunit
MANVKKNGMIIEGEYHYDLVNVDIQDEEKALPYISRWMEGMPERFSAYKNEESLKKAIALVHKRHHHVAPVKLTVSPPIHVVLKIADEILTKDGFTLNPLSIDYNPLDVDAEYSIRVRNSFPWNEIYGITEKMEKRIDRINARYSLKDDLNFSISIILPPDNRCAMLGVGIGSKTIIKCRDTDDFMKHIKGTRENWTI